MRAVGRGGPCPHCDEPVAVADLLEGVAAELTVDGGDFYLAKTRTRTWPLTLSDGRDFRCGTFEAYGGAGGIM